MDCFKESFKYLRGISDYFLCYKGFPSVVQWYSDANWITDNLDVKSIIWYIFLLRGTAISWGSKKQIIITKNTMESQLIALDTICIKAKWLKKLVIRYPFGE